MVMKQLRPLVYHAEHKTLGVDVILREIEIPDDNEIKIEIFEKIRLLTQLRHTNLSQIYGVIEDNGKFYIVQEYSDKGSIKQYASRRGIVTLPVIIKMCGQFASALRYLHEKCHITNLHLDSEYIFMDRNLNIKLQDYMLNYLSPKGKLEQKYENDDYTSMLF